MFGWHIGRRTEEEGTPVRKEERSPLGLYTIGIAALFLAGFFLLVFFGAQTYRATVTSQTGNNQTRSLLSYLATCVSGYDTAGSVSVYESEYGTVLSVRDGDTGYGLRIYRYQDALVEEYAAVDAPLSPERAQVIGETKLFRVTTLSPDLLQAETDAGRVLLRLRTGRTGEAG